MFLCSVRNLFSVLYLGAASESVVLGIKDMDVNKTECRSHAWMKENYHYSQKQSMVLALALEYFVSVHCLVLYIQQYCYSQGKQLNKDF